MTLRFTKGTLRGAPEKHRGFAQSDIIYLSPIFSAFHERTDDAIAALDYKQQGSQPHQHLSTDQRVEQKQQAEHNAEGAEDADTPKFSLKCCDYR